MKKKYLIPVYDEQDKIIEAVEFKDNLTRQDVPPYVNFNGHIGLTRCNSTKNEGRIILMYFYPEQQSDSYGEFITELEALQMCIHRNKLDVAHSLGLKISEEREVL